jgi:hypothetical protein
MPEVYNWETETWVLQELPTWLTTNRYHDVMNSILDMFIDGDDPEICRNAFVDTWEYFHEQS